MAFQRLLRSVTPLVFRYATALSAAPTRIRIFRLHHVHWLLLWLILPIPPAWSLSADDVEVDYHQGTYVGHLNFEVRVSPAVAQAVLIDFEQMARFMPGLTESRIVSRQGNVYHVAQRGRVSFGPFSSSFESLRRIEVIGGNRILSRAQGGSTRHMHSEMRILPTENGTRLDYRIELEPDNWWPSSIGSNFLQHQLAEQFNALSAEMLRRR